MLDRAGIIKKVKALGLKSDDYWVLAGSGLVLHGVRNETGDLDMGCRSGLMEEFVSQGYDVTGPLGSRKAILSEDIEIFENWFAKDIEDIEGVMTASLESIKAHKLDLNRPKDLKDIELIDVYLKQRGE